MNRRPNKPTQRPLFPTSALLYPSLFLLWLSSAYVLRGRSEGGQPAQIDLSKSKDSLFQVLTAQPAFQLTHKRGPIVYIPSEQRRHQQR
ncbi:hypothetical protein BDN70DRAFT_888387 [Pholiota conissans]|uniref:Uncharacterized protein n=1 Tax=Pholiota conissans TaxID=109636 RepID=A0A9P6CSM4_9AGAR|nr:hypothetical protein BDN70DRAFT_888387 [Pholiota conissans]